MNSTMAPAAVFAIGGILLLLVILALVVCAVIAAVRYQRIGTLAGASVVILLGVLMVGLSTVKVEVQHGAAVENRWVPPAPPMPPPLPVVPQIEHGQERPLEGADRLAMVPAGPAPTKIEHVVGSSPSLTVTDLPEWRKNPPREGSIEQGWSKYVLSSQQFATVQEAEMELIQAVITDVRLGFEHHWPETKGWNPSRDDILSSGLVTEKVIETIPLKVGEFENTVYRVSWLVEFRPDTNQTLHARWYPVEAQRRSQWILGILAGTTGMLGVAAMMLRRRAQRSAEPAASRAEYPLAS